MSIVGPVSSSPRDKIVPLARLFKVAELLKLESKSVVLAHGTFDLLHFGHVRHLDAARREGDVLIVTVTADKFVNKGPGRPVFADHIRAEMLASLAYVDYVAINEDPTAENVIRGVKPNIYVKGSDYANHEDDVTGKILEERQAVEAHGGKIVFTNEVTFSSSALINRYLDVYDPTLKEYLDNFREQSSLDRLSDLVDSVKDMKVLLVGDAIVDQYHYVNAMGKSAKEHIVATRYVDGELFAGGVFAAANHVAGFCREVEIITALGDRNSHKELIENSLKSNVKMWDLTLAGRPTTAKARYIDSGYLRKLFEVYFMDDTPVSSEDEELLISKIRASAKNADLVIVTDFGHGLLTPKVIATLIEVSPFLAVNTQTNSANGGFNLITKYARADYICIDLPEAHLAVHDKYVDVAELAGEMLPANIDCARLVVTCGKNGCATYDREAGVKRIPAFTRTVVDTVGAGDAFFVITAPLVARGADMEDVGFVGNAAGAIKVGIVGHRSAVEKPAVMKYLQSLLK